MNTTVSLDRETPRSLARLLPRLKDALAPEIAADPAGWDSFTRRLEAYFPTLFKLYYELYSTRYDFFFHLEDLLASLGRAWFNRPGDLRALEQLGRLLQGATTSVDVRTGR